MTVKEDQANINVALRVSPLLVESVQKLVLLIVALKTPSGRTSSK